MILGFLILSLLFSVGEGLRLSPFTTVNTPETLSVPTHREDSAFARNACAQNQTRKRNKGHYTVFEVPQLDDIVDEPHSQSLITDEHFEFVRIVPTRTRSGRAPPSR